MVDVFVDSTKPLCVNYKQLEVLIVGLCGFDSLSPDPKSLGTRIHSVPDSETALLLIQQNSVDQKTFSRAVLAHNRDHTNFLVPKRLQKFFRFICNDKTFSLGVLDERNRRVSSLGLHFSQFLKSATGLIKK